MEEDNEDLLSCPICLINFNITKTLDCGHSYCEGCLNNLLLKPEPKCGLCNKIDA